MDIISKVYGSSLALLTDLYELTMANGYFKSGNDDKEAVFTHFFRENPFQGGFSIACGLSYVVDYLSNFHFSDEDIYYLDKLCGSDGNKLFDSAFLDYLHNMVLECDIDAVPEGTAVFHFEPMIRVSGSLLQCQILETSLLNMINFQTLIATKASRICMAARGEPVLEFGLRRAQGIDGGLTASRAAYVGGCAGTSNVLAGKIFGIPVKGTHAHSWVMSFDSELDAFKAYADAMPNNCVFLVDTYDSMQGVRNAVEVGKRLRERGHEMTGIRLDSGDLAHLSKEARRILDEAGFKNAVIIGSNDLDEYAIQSLKEKGAAIAVWGVGTRLVTGYNSPALGGVYKLTAVRRSGEPWQSRVKLTEETLKTTLPGILQIRRYYTKDGFVGDAIFDEETGFQKCESESIVDPVNPKQHPIIPKKAVYADLLVPVFRGGKAVYKMPSIEEARKRSLDQLSHLQSGVTRLNNPERYPVWLEKDLYELKNRLIKRNRTMIP